MHIIRYMYTSSIYSFGTDLKQSLLYTRWYGVVDAVKLTNNITKSRTRLHGKCLGKGKTWNDPPKRRNCPVSLNPIWICIKWNPHLVDKNRTSEQVWVSECGVKRKKKFPRNAADLKFNWIALCLLLPLILLYFSESFSRREKTWYFYFIRSYSKCKWQWLAFSVRGIFITPSRLVSVILVWGCMELRTY